MDEPGTAGERRSLSVLSSDHTRVARRGATTPPFPPSSIHPSVLRIGHTSASKRRALLQVHAKHITSRSKEPSAREGESHRQAKQETDTTMITGRTM
jgi:hypothetical protein